MILGSEPLKPTEVLQVLFLLKLFIAELICNQEKFLVQVICSIL